MLPVTKSSLQNFAKAEAGGKGFNLYLLSNQGCRVPAWFALGPTFLEAFKKENEIGDEINNLVEQCQQDFKRASLAIEELIISKPLSHVSKQIVLQNFKDHGLTTVAVRSSALDEDSAAHSFAGQLSSFLYIKSEAELFLSIKKCWASAYSERCLFYRHQNHLPLTNIQVAVVIQQMIAAEKAGVLFTGDPTTKDGGTIIINSVYGVGEGLVSGQLDADAFFIDKNTSQVKGQNIVEKRDMVICDLELGGLKTVPVSPDKVNSSSLTPHELQDLTRIANQIENFYHHPQDVEWCFENGQLYLLQSRPITTAIPNFKGHLFVWDNSNIVESYGGLTLPLTFDFARYVYHQVYVQFCEVLMVPTKNIKSMNFFLKNMLGMFYGRVFYNLLNWYKLTSILPGYKYNRQFMETMMGTNESLQNEIAERIRPPEFDRGPWASFRKFLTGAKFLYYHFTIQTVVDDFLSYFHSIYNQFRKHDYSRMPSHEIYQDYQALEEKMLWRWHAPIINDYLCMVHFGIFKSLTKKWLSHLGDSFHNDLLAGNGNLESAEPTRNLIRLAGMISQIPALQELILSTPNNQLFEALRVSPYQDLYKKLLEYIDKYGFRCMSEMKLEQKDLHQDPSLLFVFLKNLLSAGKINLNNFEEREKEIREKAEALLDQNLSPVKKMFYRWSLHHARKAVRNRENTRFCRTRVYGIVRSMFFGIGADFTARNIINAREDIFYLSLEELKGALEGHLHTQNLKALIDIRKKEYQNYNNTEPLTRLVTRGMPYWQNKHEPLNDEHSSAPETNLLPNQLKGLGCCPGIIEGTVKVIMGPEDDLTLNGEILVTMRTDPGWIPLYPSISGLLVERGGLLSHSAIVAREMGLPTVVSVIGLTKKLKSGMKVRLNGESGLIEILD
ncbi:MAG: phosphoenolpyruvate synthase [Bdellovibrio sp.]|nr:phosphoenolpyruvate synthase [Bdellovibrio sp.]